MDKETLSGILLSRYGIRTSSLRFLREGGGTSWLAEGDGTFFLKEVGPAFAGTARQSVSVMRYLEERGFPVPKTVLTADGDALRKSGPPERVACFWFRNSSRGKNPISKRGRKRSGR